LIGLGAVFVIVSFGVNLMILGAEREADKLGAEQTLRLLNDPVERAMERAFGADRLLEIKNAHSDIADNVHLRMEDYLISKGFSLEVEQSNQTTRAGKFKLLLVVSNPLQAEVEYEGAQGTEILRTPTLVPNDRELYTLSTSYRQGEFTADQLKDGVAVPSFKLQYQILRYLFIPGFICLGLGWTRRRATVSNERSRPSTVRDRSSSLDTVLRSAPPVSPDGLYEHDPSTPDECRFGRFVRGEAIGKGAMGEVFRCTSCLPGDENVYALKVLLPEWSKAEDFRTRFEREVDVCRKFAHPNLVRAYEHGEKDGRLWMVMDFVDGEELESWLQSKPRSEEALRKMFRSICQGLDYAHKVGVVHRDLKPGNILVTRNNDQPVIADFGLAKGKHYATITKTNTTLGTPMYIAPEQITGGKGSPQSDLYSLGCVMYEALAGSPPFDEKDVMRLLALKLMQEEPPILPEDRAGAKLRNIVHKLLAHSPEERYQSAAEVVEALND
jgi:predicted Ser/Thr protein kinase